MWAGRSGGLKGVVTVRIPSWAEQGPDKRGHRFERPGQPDGDKRDERVNEPSATPSSRTRTTHSTTEASPCPFYRLAFVPCGSFPQFSCCDFFFLD